MSSLDLTPFRLLLDRMTDPVVRHAREYFWPIALPFLVVGLLLAVLQFQWLQAMASLRTDRAFVFLGLLLGGVLLLMVVYALTYLALAVAAVDAISGRAIDMRRAWRRALHLPTLGTTLVVVIVVTFSMLACFLPVFWVAPLLSLVVPVMIEEERYGFTAMSRSARLVRWNATGRWSDSGWLQTLAVLLVGTGISYAASLVVQGPFLFWQQYLTIREAAQRGSTDPAALATTGLWLQIPAQVLGAVVSVFVYAFWAFGLALLYVELRRRREAPDLVAAIDELVGEPGSPVS